MFSACIVPRIDDPSNSIFCCLSFRRPVLSVVSKITSLAISTCSLLITDGDNVHILERCRQRSYGLHPAHQARNSLPQLRRRDFEPHVRTSPAKSISYSEGDIGSQHAVAIMVRGCLSSSLDLTADNAHRSSPWSRPHSSQQRLSARYHLWWSRTRCDQFLRLAPLPSSHIVR